MSDLATSHDRLRPLMFSIAYRMLGSVAEAEDVVQEAFLKMYRRLEHGERLDSEDAYATTVTTRLAIDALRSANRRREQYVGPWLPEPLLADDLDPAHRIEMDESVSIAFLVLLERLSPVERAVFMLREVLGYDYAEISAVVERSEEACRQLQSRAKRHIDSGRPRYEPSASERDRLAAAFLHAVAQGDVGRLERVLADDVVFYGDGGGNAPALRHPLDGRVKVARFLLGLSRQAKRMGVRITQQEANGQPAATAHSPSGDLLGVLTLEIADGHVRTVRNLINPEKLRHLGHVGDLSQLLSDC